MEAEDAVIKRLLIKLIILGLLAAIFLVPFFSRERKIKEKPIIVAAEEAVILFMEGEVKVRKADADGWVEAAPGMVLLKGDRIKTGLNSWVGVGFGQDFENVIRIKEMTRAELVDLGPVKIGLLRGELRSLVESLDKGSTFEIRTPTSVCAARGTGWDTKTDGQEVIVDTYEDRVFLNKLSKDGRVLGGSTVEAGQRAILKDPRQPIVIEDLPAHRIEDWKDWKEDFIERRETKREVKKPKAEERKPKVWVEKEEDGDYQLMITEEEEQK